MRADTGRKIPLDTKVYCPLPYVADGQADCDHDYDPAPVRESDAGATWRCTRCGQRVTYDVWE